MAGPDYHALLPDGGSGQRAEAALAEAGRLDAYGGYVLADLSLLWVFISFSLDRLIWGVSGWKVVGITTDYANGLALCGLVVVRALINMAYPGCDNDTLDPNVAPREIVHFDWDVQNGMPPPPYSWIAVGNCN